MRYRNARLSLGETPLDQRFDHGVADRAMMAFSPFVVVTTILLLHSLFSLSEPGARLTGCGAMHRT
jgi:hypothetical protein